MKLIDYQPPKAERRTDAPFTFPNQRPLPAADRRAPFPSRGRGTYIKPRHLLIASLCCWAVVAILIGVLI